ncbi:DUF6879 family protein [Streptomyces sp. DI166]|uniref:DUF6879 family protein n=1 Tax=Streptomyces sp. DI166 TaxID=1839783 RepID=UPI0030155BFF
MPSNVPTSFTDLLAACTRSAVHLEMRDSCAVDYEKGPFTEWRAGHRPNPDDRASSRRSGKERFRTVSTRSSDFCRSGVL